MKNILSWILFNENNDSQILPIENSDIPEVLNVCAEALQHVDTPDNIKQYLGKATKWSISKKCVLDGRIIGAYLLNEFPLDRMLDDAREHCKVCDFPPEEEYEKYHNLRGLQGLALVVKPEFQKIGAGKKLRDVPLHMGYDYIWGMHLAT